MSHGRIVTVNCQCGKKLFKYYKAGRGRLVKCFISRITHDYIGIIEMKDTERPQCPNCGNDLGMMRLIRGEIALKINQGAIKKVMI